MSRFFRLLLGLQTSSAQATRACEKPRADETDGLKPARMPTESAAALCRENDGRHGSHAGPWGDANIGHGPLIAGFCPLRPGARRHSPISRFLTLCMNRRCVAAGDFETARLGLAPMYTAYLQSVRDCSRAADRPPGSLDACRSAEGGKCPPISWAAHAAKSQDTAKTLYCRGGHCTL